MNTLAKLAWILWGFLFLAGLIALLRLVAARRREPESGRGVGLAFAGGLLGVLLLTALALGWAVRSGSRTGIVLLALVFGMPWIIATLRLLARAVRRRVSRSPSARDLPGPGTGSAGGS